MEVLASNAVPRLTPARPRPKPALNDLMNSKRTRIPKTPAHHFFSRARTSRDQAVAPPQETVSTHRGLAATSGFAQHRAKEFRSDERPINTQ
jgi:hypothetical protein